MSLTNFLLTHKAEDGNKPTHTRIGDKDLGIYGGKYHFGSNEQEFYKLLYNEVYNGVTYEYLTEKQRPDGTVIADFDFRYPTEIQTRQHTDKDIASLIELFLESIAEIFVVNSSFNIYVLQKPTTNNLKDKTKDGIHFVFGFDATREGHIKLRQTMIKKLNKNREIILPLTNTWEDVYDDAIASGRNNWMILGCRKPGQDAYTITHIYQCELDPNDNEFGMILQDPIQQLSFDTYLELSIRTPKLLFALKHVNPSEIVCEAPIITKPYDSNDKYLDLLFNVIRNDKDLRGNCIINYENWFRIAKILKCNNYEFDVLERYTNLCDPNNDKTEKIWNGIKMKTVSIHYLENIAKQINPTLYDAWLKKHKQTEQIICVDEKSASEYIYNSVKNILVSYQGRLFYKLNNVWLNDEKKIDDAMMLHIMNSNIYTGTEEKRMPFAQNVSKARRIQEALFCKIRIENEDPQIYDKFHLSTKGGICFEDGFLDFKHKNFFTWDKLKPDDIYTTIKIPRKYADYFKKPDKTVINELKTKIFEPLYGENMEQALQFLSRAIAGHREDKRWATYLGNRDCGKGVEYELLFNAFGQYVSQFELSNILYNRLTSGFENIESSKKLYWLLDYEHVRLAISQEVPEPGKGDKANSKILKKMTGGGDTFVARRNYDRKDTHFTIDATFYIKGNNSLVCDTEDSKDTCLEFSSFVQFKSEDEINYLKDSGCNELVMKKYRISDPSIKFKCKTEEWANAMVYLLYENYRYTAVPVNRKYDIENNNIINTLFEKLVITNNNENHIPCTDVYKLFFNPDKEKICLELESLEIKKKNVKQEIVYV